MFLSRGDRDLGVAFQTHPGRQAFISSGRKEPRSVLESRRVSLGAHWVDSRESSLLRRLERGRDQGIFPTQGSNWGLPHFRWILYHLSHQGSPRIMQWVTLSFLQGSSWPRNWTEVSCIAGRFFTSWATKEVQDEHGLSQKVSSVKGGWSLDRLCQINTITVSHI